MGSEANFTCVIRNAQSPHWMVNATEVSGNVHERHLARSGVFIQPEQEKNGNTTLSLRVDGSNSCANNTRIICRDGANIASPPVYLTILRGE